MLASVLPNGKFANVSTLAERLVLALEHSGISQNGLDAEAKLPKGYTSRIKNSKRTRVNPDLIRRMADVLRVNFEWLAIGNGAMLPEPDLSSDAKTADKVEYPPQEQPVREVVRERDERYPNRTAAWKHLESLGETFSPSTVFEVNSMALSSDSDPTMIEWIDMIRSHERQKKFQRKFGIKWHEPIRDEDEEF